MNCYTLQHRFTASISFYKTNGDTEWSRKSAIQAALAFMESCENDPKFEQALRLAREFTLTDWAVIQPSPASLPPSGATLSRSEWKALAASKLPAGANVEKLSNRFYFIFKEQGSGWVWSDEFLTEKKYQKIFGDLG